MTAVVREPPLRFEPASGLGGAEAPFRTALRGLAIGPGDRVYAVGDSGLRVWNADATPEREWPTERAGHGVAVDGAGRVWVGETGQIEVFEPDGRLVDTWRDPPRLGRVTAIAFRDGDVFAADASARCIQRYDLGGRFRNAIGDTHRKGGFHIPNGIVDFAVDDDGVLHVANPGMHRVERWSAAGEKLRHFGRFDGRDPAGFGGCCNPTNLALDAAGRIAVSEKARPRVKFYSPEGALLTVVADEGFDPGAKNMDLAVDSRGRLYVADTGAREIRVFRPVAGEAAS